METNIKIVIFYFVFPIGVDVDVFADKIVCSRFVSSKDTSLH
jgi:hypothetical protein